MYLVNRLFEVRSAILVSTLVVHDEQLGSRLEVADRLLLFFKLTSAIRVEIKGLHQSSRAHVDRHKVVVG